MVREEYILDEQARVEQYLGPIGNTDPTNVIDMTIPDDGDLPAFHYSSSAENVLSWDPKDEYTDFGEQAWILDKPWSTYPINRDRKWIRDILLRNGVTEGRFAVIVGDQWSKGKFPIFSPYSTRSKRVHLEKPNLSRQERGGVCLKLLYYRWWGPLYDILPQSMKSFSDKKDMCVWRGASSGWHTVAGNRFELIKKWFNVREDLDVAFVTQNIKNHADEVIPIQGDNVFKSIDMLNWADNKYIISSPGNMNESGLHWKLASNSVILMSPPEACTWLLEDKLIPGFHYVRVKDDWSDLGDQLDWCKENQDICEQIARNAREFAEQFSDMDKERRIEAEVLRRYFLATNDELA